MNEGQQFDRQITNKINYYIEKANNEGSSLYYGKILQITKDLLGKYSFIENQTYPRPNHPLKEMQADVYFTTMAILISIRTTLENEQKAVGAFMKNFKNPYMVLETPADKIAEIITPAGMPQKKAETILKATDYIVNKMQNNWEPLRQMPISDARQELQKIPGIGDKASDCILELGLDRPSIVIDVNMLRVVSRIFGLPNAQNPNLGNPKETAQAKAVLESNLDNKDALLYQVIHTMYLLHGKNICKASPQCKKCVIYNNCDLYKKTHLF